MKRDARLQAVIELAENVWKSTACADNAVRGYMKNRRYIGGGDRKEIARVFWDMSRMLGRLRALDADLTPRKALLGYLFYAGENRDGVRAVFSGAQYAPYPLDAGESAFLDALPDELPDISFEAPEFLRQVISKETLEALSRPAPLDLRVNTLKATREDVLEMLKKDGIHAEKTPYAPTGVRVFDRPDLRRHRVIEDGFADVQDEGSQLVSLLSGVKAGETVVDWCAGAGGKTLALSAMMNNKGRIDAVDYYPHRMKDLPERVRRAGCENVRILEQYPVQPESYDAVLLDAPCSSTGTWRRQCYLKWRTTPESVREIVATQAQILNNAAPFVKKGGRLVYVTCSLLAQENDLQIQAFLKAHPEYELDDLSAEFNALTGAQSRGETASIRPEAFGTDGFFIARMIRK